MQRVVGPHWANPRFLARFQSRLKRVGRCLEWQGSFMSVGYGSIGFGDRNSLCAHRVAWSIANQRDIPKGFDICHHCDNRKCCEPTHLFLGTRRDNMLDAKAKGRTTVGSRNAMAKLTWAEVRMIRASTARNADLARQLAICASQISMIRRGLAWVERPAPVWDDLPIVREAVPA
jgi:hypothetical protein